MGYKWREIMGVAKRETMGIARGGSISKLEIGKYE